MCICCVKKFWDALLRSHFMKMFFLVFSSKAISFKLDTYLKANRMLSSSFLCFKAVQTVSKDFSCRLNPCSFSVLFSARFCRWNRKCLASYCLSFADNGSSNSQRHKAFFQVSFTAAGAAPALLWCMRSLSERHLLLLQEIQQLHGVTSLLGR